MAIDAAGDAGTRYVTRLAIDQDDLDAVARLRYEVHVAELGKDHAFADAQRRLLPDPGDAAADLLMVHDQAGALVGTIRSSGVGSGQSWTAQDGLYTLREFAHLPRAELGLCSHLAVHRDHRKFVVRELLFRALYALQLERGIRLCFTTCPPMLARLFEHYGFREYGMPVQDPQRGSLRRLVLGLDDLEHLQRVHSPFLELAHARGIAPASRPWLEELIGHWSNDPRP